MQRKMIAASWEALRDAVQEGIAQQLPPERLQLVPAEAAQGSLFAAAPEPAGSAAAPARRASSLRLRLPRPFVQAARAAALHSQADRYDLIYRMAWRLTHGEHALMDQGADVDVLALDRLCRAVHRDVHKCHAFVRFRTVPDADAPGGRHYVAWYEPDHPILPLAIEHFVERFATMHWTILTPDVSATFRDGALIWGPGARREDAPAHDAMEAVWATYYRSIFNPARLNLRATRQEMPKRFWGNMPETQNIAAMVREAPARAQAFLDAQPKRAIAKSSYTDLTALGTDVRGCTVCPWAAQTHGAVLGAGPRHARLMAVGEQPGDQEDLQARAFVGPAGQLLDEALQQAGLPRDEMYVTNAVKHFKFTQSGKRRLHQKPSATDVAACRSWLAAEVTLVQPEVLLCLGTTAALAVFGRLVRLRDVRGSFVATPACPQTFVTTHPSAILRTPQAEQAAAMALFVAELRQVAERLRAA